MPPNMQEELEQPLEKFGTDITALAKEHKLDPVIGRDGGDARRAPGFGRRGHDHSPLHGRAVGWACAVLMSRSSSRTSWIVKDRTAPGAELAASRRDVGVPSRRDRAAQNHDSATDRSPHNGRVSEARRSGVAIDFLNGA